MTTLPPWVEHVYNQDWPDHVMDKDQWLDWHKEASRGRRPKIEDVVKIQYGNRAPWYLREALWEPLQDVGNWTGKKREAFEMARGVGKTEGSLLLNLWLGEYVLPYIEKVPSGMEIGPENRRANIVSRSAQHVGDENIHRVHQKIAYKAPWLKLPDQPDLWEDPEGVLERQMRKRKFNMRRLDFTPGSSIRGYGWDQSTRGSHPLVADVDDLVTEDNWTLAEEQYDTLQGGIVPSVIPGGAIVVQGTPQAPGDMYDIIADSGSWTYNQYPGYDKDGSLGYREKNEQEIDRGVLPRSAITRDEDWHCLNPLFMPFDELESMRGEDKRDEVNFRREILLERVVSTLQLVDPNDLQHCMKKDLTFTYSVGPSHPNPIYCGIDPSMLKGSDMAFVVLEKQEDGTRRILAIEIIDASEETDPLTLIQRINNLHKRYHPKFLIEGNAFQSFVKPFMEALVNGIDIDDLSISNIKHESGGWRIIGKYAEAHALEIPYALSPTEKMLIDKGVIDLEDTEAKQKSEKLRDQALSLMYANGKVVEDNNTKTDVFSALYMALRASQEGRGVPPGVQGADIKRILKETQAEQNPEIKSTTVSTRTDHNVEPGDRLERARNLDNR